MAAVIAAEEHVIFSFPCMIDDEPIQSMQYAGPKTKVKFQGKANRGAVFLTEENFKLAEDLGASVNAASFPWSTMSQVNPLALKFSTQSMTSARPGFELLFQDGSEQLRLLMRLEVTPRPGVDVVAELCARIGR